MKWLLVVALAMVGCGGPARDPAAPSTSRAHIRSALAYVAHAVDDADRICGSAIIALNTDHHSQAVAVGKACVSGRALSKAGLKDAEDVLDVLDEVGTNDGLVQKIGCAAGRTLQGIAETIGALQTAGVAVPPKVADALAEVQWLSQLAGNACVIPADAGVSDGG